LFQPVEGGPKKRLRKQKEPKEPENTATVLYIGHIPHGFYEEQMQGGFLCSIDRT
jgi:nucleolar protein 15